MKFLWTESLDLAVVVDVVHFLAASFTRCLEQQLRGQTKKCSR